jgi:hypothetical protein
MLMRKSTDNLSGNKPIDNGRLPLNPEVTPDRGDAWEGDTPTGAESSPAHVQPGREPPVSTPNDRAPDPFDPASLRLSQDFSVAVGVKKALLTVPVRKPDKSWFVRVHPDPTYRLQTAVIELKEDREIYLVAPALWPELAAEATFRPKLLATAINRQGVVFLWDVNLPRTDGRADEWSRTALEALDMASTRWVRVVANMALGGYEVYFASGELGEPTWPELPFRDLLRVAFKDRYITDRSHPVWRRLRGEV